MRFLMKEKIESSAAFLKTKGIDQIELGVVLGTGLDGLASDIELLQKIPYHDIPHFPTSTQTYQKGRLLYGCLLYTSPSPRD